VRKLRAACAGAAEPRVVLCLAMVLLAQKNKPAGHAIFAEYKMTGYAKFVLHSTII
jgi:hypothetical protein